MRGDGEYVVETCPLSCRCGMALSLTHTRCRWRRVSWGERFVRCMHKFKAQEERDEKGEKVLGSREKMKEHGCASGYDSAAR